jgi:hypothetical protein
MTTDVDLMNQFIRGEVDPDSNDGLAALAFIDQVCKATDVMRAQTGIVSDGRMPMPWARSMGVRKTLWFPLLTWVSAGRVCVHLEDAEPQPTYIIAERAWAFCAPCFIETGWQDATHFLTPKEAKAIRCDACNRLRFKSDADVWRDPVNLFHFLALVRLCMECHQVMAHNRTEIPRRFRDEVQ